MNTLYCIPDDAEDESSDAGYGFFGLPMAGEDDTDWEWRELWLSKLVRVAG